MLVVAAVNQSEAARISDYNVIVYVNEHPIAWLQVKGHCRADGWPALLRLIANEAEK